jgi:pimeloyl-ACP methyl ester carboxylesterase
MTIKKVVRKIFQIIGIIVAVLIVLIFVLMRFIAPNFLFKTEKEQVEYMQKAGQEMPTFGTSVFDGETIHYTHIGDTTKPLVLFVHGSPGASDAFLNYLGDTALSKICQMISVDRLGFGESSSKGEPSIGKQAAVLKPIIEKYKNKNKIILVGHSLGGPIIARMAMDYGELIDGLVIIAGSIDPELEPNEWFRPALQYPPLKWFMNDAFQASNLEIMPLVEELEAMIPMWEKITIPVTVIQGTKDNLVPAGNADFAEKMLVNSKKMDIQRIEGENHFVLWSQPEIINQAIYRLLE